jgi:hypothetical protein
MPSHFRASHEFPREGFTLHVDRDGIEIQVDEYHPRPLKLSWARLEQLRREASATEQGGAS